MRFSMCTKAPWALPYYMHAAGLAHALLLPSSTIAPIHIRFYARTHATEHICCAIPDKQKDVQRLASNTEAHVLLPLPTNGSAPTHILSYAGTDTTERMCCPAAAKVVPCYCMPAARLAHVLLLPPAPRRVLAFLKLCNAEGKALRFSSCVTPKEWPYVFQVM